MHNDDEFRTAFLYMLRLRRELTLVTAQIDCQKSPDRQFGRNVQERAASVCGVLQDVGGYLDRWDFWHVLCLMGAPCVTSEFLQAHDLIRWGPHRRQVRLMPAGQRFLQRIRGAQQPLDETTLERVAQLCSRLRNILVQEEQLRQYVTDAGLPSDTVDALFLQGYLRRGAKSITIGTRGRKIAR